MNICSRAIPDMYVGHSRYVHRPMNIGSLSGFIFSPQHTNKFVCVQLIENVHFSSCLFVLYFGVDVHLMDCIVEIEGLMLSVATQHRRHYAIDGLAYLFI